MGCQDAGFHIAQQLAGGQQRVQLPGLWFSEAGQLVGGACGFGVLKVIATRIPISDDRDMEPLSHVFYVPLEGGAGNVQFLQKSLDRHHLPLVEHLVDLVKTLSTVHGSTRDGNGSVFEPE
ncbi:hypothetical protein [Nitrosospira sp. Nsp18]|uniref:hypothetical protein n=1 Tax=Nitrosospira sp. Nsp18 TaxID=1855334 RepID=UPI002108F65F|nr:hypothetical protein [Nitrosospira sp. Nsp18]